MLQKSTLLLLPFCPKSIFAQVKAKPSKHHLTNCLPLHANRVIFRPFHANRVIFAPFTHFLPLCSPCACWPTPIRVGKWCKKMVELHKIDLMVFNTQASRMPRPAIARILPFPIFPSAGVEFDQSPLAPLADIIIILMLWSWNHTTAALSYFITEHVHHNSLMTAAVI